MGLPPFVPAPVLHRGYRVTLSGATEFKRSWFNEGFDTAGLKEATALLDAML